MAIDLTSIGAKCMYAVEGEAGTRPTSGYTHIPGIKSIPALDPAPDTLETTSLDNKEFKTYTNGLKDLGGSLEFTAGLTQELFDVWMKASTGIMAKYEAAKKEKKAMWFCIVIPGLDKANYFSFEPSPIGVPEMSVNSVLDVSLYITPTGEPTWEDAPSDLQTASATNYAY